FTDEERSDPALEKPIRKAEKAAARADKAQANIPKKKVRQTVIDPDTGKKTSKLTFEDKKKPPSKVSQGVREAPVHLVVGKLHKEIRETEQDNVGVESAHKSEEAVETGAYLVREGYRSHKLKPYRKAAQAERQLEKANVNVLYQKSLQENPQFASNPLSRVQQKWKLKRRYSKEAKAAAKQGAKAAKKTAAASGTATRRAAQFVTRHPVAVLVLLLLLLLCFLVSAVSSIFPTLGSGLANALSGTSYASEDTDLLGVDEDYTALENELAQTVANIESTHPGYDEYRY
ncbi:CHAP domain-containing protein, partial [Soehngenia saccharolytica]